MKLNESSLKDLYLSAVNAFPKTTKRQHAVDPIIVEELRWIPFLGVKTLFIRGHTRNEDRHYNTIVLFKNVDYQKNEVKITASDHKIYNFGKLSLENTDVLLRCNCPDFQWRFNYYNHLDKSLYGSKRRQYENDSGVPANPLELPGMCKHLIATVKALKEARIF
jgi:hypothetical protein